MNSKGFSLLEIMVVIAIVGVLGALAIPLYSGYTNRAKRVEAEEQLMTIAAIEEDYFNTFRKYLSDTTTLKQYYGADLTGKNYTITVTLGTGSASYTATACVCYKGQTCSPCDMSCQVTNTNPKSVCTKP